MKKRVLWMAWSDENKGFIAALYGSTKNRRQMELRLEKEYKHRRLNPIEREIQYPILRPVKVIVEY